MADPHQSSAREQRLSAKLRENLQRRKAQSREQAGAAPRAANREDRDGDAPERDAPGGTAPLPKSPSTG